MHAFHSRADRHAFALGLDIPVLVVAGEYDLNPPRLEAFAAELRHGSFALVRGAGHFVSLERPAELAALVGSFLAGVAHPFGQTCP